jgi:hypothetical protein
MRPLTAKSEGVGDPGLLSGHDAPFNGGTGEPFCPAETFVMGLVVLRQRLPLGEIELVS